MKEVVQSIIQKYAGGSYHWRKGTRVEHPEHGLVEITGGCYCDPTYGRVSNWWYWRKVNSDGSLGKKQYSGYGWA